MNYVFAGHIDVYKECSSALCETAAPELLLLDVTPLSLGFETVYSIMNIVIPRNVTVPTRKSVLVTTCQDNQTSMKIHLFEGERGLTGFNHSLGYLELHGIEHVKRCLPQIELTFDIDANGVLRVSAVDKVSGSESKHIINDKGTFSSIYIEYN